MCPGGLGVGRFLAAGAGIDAVYAVRCRTPSFCVAVGYHLIHPNGPLQTNLLAAEIWNGRAWRLSKVPRTAATPAGIACPASRECLAVGQTDNYGNLAMLWNGSRWRILSPVNP